MKTLIIGGVAGGASAAARLRRLDENCEIIILERGEYVSFANCGLPYYIGGDIKNRSDLTLQTPESFKARFNIDVRENNVATAIHPDINSVSVTDFGCINIGGRPGSHHIETSSIFTPERKILLLSIVPS